MWNTIVSRRINKFGRTPVAGDLVIHAEGQPGDLPEVRAILESDVGGLTLHDIVLPSPGYGVVYPKYLRACYDEVSQELFGMPLEAFHNSKLVELSGAYRNIGVLPKGLDWRLATPEEVNKPNAALLPSDLTKLLEERGPLPGSNNESDLTKLPEERDSLPGSNNKSLADEGEAGADSDANDKGSREESVPMEADEAALPTTDGAVVFSCTLPASSYLTMLLREILRRKPKS